ncbi:MAG: hypothetical protein M1833_000336 [Piccolia ochrophora]|nr:MAG: hypothetical protein M1833_000336 [Piccolia ochrophora]
MPVSVDESLGNMQTVTSPTKAGRRRRGSDKGLPSAGPMTQREFAESNSTMLAFVGGKRKAWMDATREHAASRPRADPHSALDPKGSPFPSSTEAFCLAIPNKRVDAASRPDDAETTVRPAAVKVTSATRCSPQEATPSQRPPSNAADVANTRTMSSPSGTGIISGSTSPMLANAVHKRSDAQLGAANGVSLLSPTPSDDGKSIISIPEKTPVLQYHDRGPSNVNVVGSGTEASDDQHTRQTRSLLPPSDAGTKEARTAPLCNDAGGDSDTPLQATSPTQLEGRIQDFIAKFGIERMEGLLQSVAEQPVNRANTSPAGQPPSKRPRTDTSRNQRVGGPAANGQARTQTVVPQKPSAKSNNSRSAVAMTPNTMQIHQLKQVLDNHVIQLGGPQALDANLELPRIRLLQDACTKEDWFYVALHQLYCSLTLNQETTVHVAGLDKTQVGGFDWISSIIRPNEILSIQRLRWFASFPSPLDQLLRVSKMYREAVEYVKVFLSNVCARLPELQRACLARDYPPLVHELVYILALKSKVLQRVVFTSIHRNMWGLMEDQYFAKTEELFRMNQQDYHNVLSRLHTASPVAEPVIRERNNQICNEYRRLRDLQVRQQNFRSEQPQQTSVQNNQSGSPLANQPLRSGPSNGMPVMMLRTDPSPSTRMGQQHAWEMRAPTTQVPVVHGVGSARSNQLQGRRVPPKLHVNTTAAQQMAVSSPMIPSSISSTTTPSQSLAVHPLFSAGISSEMQRLQMGSQHPMSRAYTNVQLGRSPPGSATSFTGWRSPISTPPDFVAQNVPSSSIATQAPGLRPPLAHSRSTPSSGFAAPTTSRAIPPHHRAPPQRAAGTGSPTPRASASRLPRSVGGPALISTPASAALHQAHLRSPHLLPRSTTREETAPRLYTFVKEFCVHPTLMMLDAPRCNLQFLVREEDVKSIPREQPSHGTDGRTFRTVEDGSLTYRFRCCKLSSADEDLSEAQWVLKENTWPEHLFIRANGTNMEIRRKLQHGADLPLNITGKVKEGLNDIEVNILRTATEKDRKSKSYYAFAVEVITVTTHERILENCMDSNMIPAMETINAMKSSLARENTDADADDELAVISSQRALNVTDPFSTRVFDIPVRATGCRHHDCFDLDTFLQTRKRHSNHPHAASDPSHWKCPLCLGDARPMKLRTDAFLKGVSEKLKEQGLLSIKAITVNQDGSWEPKESRDELSLRRSRGLGRSQTPREPVLADTKETKEEDIVMSESVVVNLDDSDDE